MSDYAWGLVTLPLAAVAALLLVIAYELLLAPDRTTIHVWCPVRECDWHLYPGRRVRPRWWWKVIEFRHFLSRAHRDALLRAQEGDGNCRT